MNTTTATALTDEMIAEVLDICRMVGADAYPNHNDRLGVQFGPNDPLADFARFIALLVEFGPSELGRKLASCVRNVAHGSYGLEVEFTEFSGAGFPDDDE